MSNQLFIIHFLPLEGYPPIINLLDYFSSKNGDLKITCTSSKGFLKPRYKNNKVNTYRIGKISNNKLILWITYFFFFTFNILLLFFLRPKNVIYYETISSFPAYIYIKYINKKANLFIHYHEYVTKKEYASGGGLNSFFHKLELQIYPLIKQISHTNNVRLQNFLSDNNILYNDTKHKVYANYPSKRWAKELATQQQKDPVKLVFVGHSIDPKGCFIVELVEWLKNQETHTILDLYCLNKVSLPKNLTGNQTHTTVNLFSAIPYNELPKKLKNYHIGIIIYKATTPNVIHCAPNKLFEYLACGLDVWFPEEMEGCFPYETEDVFPKVIKMDYKNLNNVQLESLIDRKNLDQKESMFYYENTYDTLYKEFV